MFFFDVFVFIMVERKVWREEENNETINERRKLGKKGGKTSME